MVEELEGLVEIFGYSFLKIAGGNFLASIAIILFVIMIGFAVRAGAENIALFVILTTTLLAMAGMLPAQLIGIMLVLMAIMIFAMFYDLLVKK